MKSLSYLVRKVREDGATFDVTQCTYLADAMMRADEAAKQPGIVSAFVIDLETPVGRGHKIVYSA